LVLERGEASLCLRHPGFEPDLEVEAELAALYDVYVGRTTLAEAVGRRTIRIDGPPDLVRASPGWFTWSRFAPAVRERFAPARPAGPASVPARSARHGRESFTRPAPAGRSG
ncbi:MAG TPA: hypothetical protein VNJ28_01325, partial [Candidatus Limnocylindrales bacterium]|nr:hypothetical protein [Candidatus Limnocylindrales bacterium]